MREIKFRGKYLSTGEWVYGYLLKDEITDQVFIFPFGNSVNENMRVSEEGYLKFFAHEVDPATVGQYVGVQDKNDKESYIGDIGKSFYGDNIVVIEWHKTNPWIVLRYVDSRNGMYSFDHLRLEAFEIIGNIYDNPALLTQ